MITTACSGEIKYKMFAKNQSLTIEGFTQNLDRTFICSEGSDAGFVTWAFLMARSCFARVILPPRMETLSFVCAGKSLPFVSTAPTQKRRLRDSSLF